MTTEPILPGLEDAFTAMQMNAASDDAIEKLPVFTAERVAVHDKDRYELAARLLFSENISRRTICKWLHMSPNTLSAIEVRELRLHPEYVKALQEESKAEIEQLKRLGLEAMRARFFDKNAMSKTGLKDIATCVKLLNEMSSSPVQGEPQNTNRNTDNDYIDLIDKNSPYYGLCRGKSSAPETADCLEVEALGEQRNTPYNGTNRGESSGEQHQSQVATTGVNSLLQSATQQKNKGIEYV